ncbi:hypothetical protein SBADM41S_11253 [Streptomyces badius]
MALRPGEQVQIDTTRLDVLALFDDGRLARPELTIAVDVATRAILASYPDLGLYNAHEEAATW